MDSLFTISNKLQETMSLLEENGGEITPEIEEALTIGEDNLKEKIGDYSNLISSLKYDIDNCTSEIKRITELKKKKAKLLDRLSNIVIGAIDTFGSENKNNVRYIDLGTKKLSVHNNQKCDVDTDKVNLIGENLTKFISEIKDYDSFGEESFSDDFIVNMDETINHDDIENTRMNIIISAPISSLLDNENKLLSKVVKDFDCKIVCDVNKTECKNLLNSGVDLTYASFTPTKSLIER